jgi:hypothetical protein
MIPKLHQPNHRLPVLRIGRGQNTHHLSHQSSTSDQKACSHLAQCHHGCHHQCPANQFQANLANFSAVSHGRAGVKTSVSDGSNGDRSTARNGATGAPSMARSGSYGVISTARNGSNGVITSSANSPRPRHQLRILEQRLLNQTAPSRRQDRSTSKASWPSSKRKRSSRRKSAVVKNPFRPCALAVPETHHCPQRPVPSIMTETRTLIGMTARATSPASLVRHSHPLVLTAQTPKSSSRRHLRQSFTARLPKSKHRRPRHAARARRASA